MGLGETRVEGFVGFSCFRALGFQGAVGISDEWV